jgi:hypothetical protein
MLLLFYASAIQFAALTTVCIHVTDLTIVTSVIVPVRRHTSIMCAYDAKSRLLYFPFYLSYIEESCIKIIYKHSVWCRYPWSLNSKRKLRL